MSTLKKPAAACFENVSGSTPLQRIIEYVVTDGRGYTSETHDDLARRVTTQANLQIHLGFMRVRQSELRWDLKGKDIDQETKSYIKSVILEPSERGATP